MTAMPEGGQTAQLHEALLQMLLVIDGICRRHGIPYQLAAGTLLGAIREQNIIAWDKDADVCMLRKDFQRFMQVAEAELDQRYFLQHHASEPQMFSLVTKLRLNGSRLRLLGDNEPAVIHDGVFVDIFPFDEVQPETLMGRLHMSACAWSKAVFLIRSAGDQRRLWRTRRSLLARLAGWCAYPVLRRVSKERLIASVDWLVTLYSRRAMHDPLQSTGYVSCLVSMPFAGKKRLPRVRARAAFEVLTVAYLSGHEFPVPANYHEVLTNLYGDYLLPPPDQERHFSYQVEIPQGRN